MLKIKIDCREHELIAKTKQLIETLPSFQNLVLETGSLPLGDIVFEKEGQDVWLLERKTIQDLAASIKDGRYEEQSFRLHGLNMPTHNIVYLIEGNLHSFGQNSFKDRIDKLTLYSALFSLNYYKGFSVLRTFSLEETALFICNSANKCIKQADKEPFFQKKRTKEEPEEKEKEKEKEEQEKEYVSVVKKVKKENVTPSNIDEIMLTQIPGISTTTALAIMKHFPNLFTLIQQCKQDPNCLAHITYQNEKGQTRKLNKTIVQNIQTFLVK